MLKLKLYATDLTVYAVVNNVNDRVKLQNELNNNNNNYNKYLFKLGRVQIETLVLKPAEDTYTHLHTFTHHLTTTNKSN